jgi:hypothetical protein
MMVCGLGSLGLGLGGSNKAAQRGTESQNPITYSLHNY